MFRRSFPSLSLMMLLAGCQPEAGKTTHLLPEEDRAPQFDKVSEFLDLGGVFYAYMDMTGEIAKFGKTLNEVINDLKEGNPDVPPLPLDAGAFLSASGLSDLEAIGMSSRELDPGYFHNRSILFFPEGPHGLFDLFGETPHPFDSLDIAPAGADLVFEMSYDPPAVRNSVVAMSKAVGGNMGTERISSELSKSRPELSGRSIDDLINGAGNRILVVFEFAEDGERFFFGPDQSVPEIRYVVGVDGITELILSLREEIEDQDGFIWMDTDTGFRIETPATHTGMQPLIIADTTTGRAFLASSADYLDQCLSAGGKLKDTAAFKNAANLLPPEGVSFAFIAPALFDPFREAFVDRMNSAPGGLDESITSQVTDFFFSGFAKPIASVTTVGPEGIYSASNSATSHRSTIVSFALQPLALVGLSTAMAIPAFNKVRENSEEKTVLNNLRQVASGGQQYLLENGGERVSYSQIAGEYFPPLLPVAGEDYTQLTVYASGGTLSVTLNDGRVVDYTYD